MSDATNNQANAAMNNAPSATPSASPAANPSAHAFASTPQPFYWSVRRELWENRSIYIAPLAVAGLILLSFFARAAHLPARVRAAEALDSADQISSLAQPYVFSALIIMIVAILVGIFYSLDALHGERRDRSILFWKSLPVSDLTAVLAKFSIPMLVIPAVTFVTILAVQIIMRVLSTMVLAANGMSAAVVWTQVPLSQMSLVLLYGLLTNAIWYAPIYGWLLLVSAWAKRNTFLWAIFIPFGIAVVEGIVLHSANFLKMAAHRFNSFEAAFDMSQNGDTGMITPLSALTPAKYLASPGLWIGLAVAAAFLAAAVQLRRYRQPI
jgi:ABC-2 type transport system permease protein